MKSISHVELFSKSDINNIVLGARIINLSNELIDDMSETHNNEDKEDL
ncbi:hypothetical protein OKW96_00740 [Sphingobacterium sp. KU25419]|nr:hypothetical protein OKW96_00740 [Sphingobacterium sp. KU25419]